MKWKINNQDLPASEDQDMVVTLLGTKAYFTLNFIMLPQLCLFPPYTPPAPFPFYDSWWIQGTLNIQEDRSPPSHLACLGFVDSWISGQTLSDLRKVGIGITIINFIKELNKSFWQIKILIYDVLQTQYSQGYSTNSFVSKRLTHDILPKSLKRS